MHLLYGLLGLTGVLSVGGASLYLTRRRWLAEETSRLKSALLARLGHDMAHPAFLPCWAWQSFCAVRTCARRKKTAPWTT